jgi:hemoglobin-like flavoprotein
MIKMTPNQIKLVQESWAKVVPIADTAAGLFYDKLFELDPALKGLFVSFTVQQQQKKLIAMLGSAVAGLNNIDALVPVVQALGERHGGYGVIASDYNTVAGALLWTLEQGLGDAWNRELKDAWTAVYVVLSGAMIQAADAKAA